MPNSYPLWFKKQVTNYYTNNLTVPVKDVLHIFKISNGSLFNWINLSINNVLEEKKLYTRRSVIVPVIKCYIRSYVLKRVHFSYKLLLILIRRKYKIQISKSSLYDIISKFNISRKKINTIPVSKSKVKHNKDIRKFKNKIKNIKHNSIISIDESHFDNKISANYGWSLKGSPIKQRIYLKSNKRYSLLCAISNRKVVHHKIIDGSVNALVFKQFIVDLNDKIPNNSFLLLDNARIHHAHIVKEYIALKGHTLIYNAPYCPEYNPIEKVFSKIKSYIRSKTNNTNPINLKLNIVKSLKSIRNIDLRNFYRKSLVF